MTDKDCEINAEYVEECEGAIWDLMQALDRAERMAALWKRCARKMRWQRDNTADAMNALGEVTREMDKEREHDFENYKSDIEAMVALHEKQLRALRCCGNCAHYMNKRADREWGQVTIVCDKTKVHTPWHVCADWSKQ